MTTQRSAVRSLVGLLLIASPLIAQTDRDAGRDKHEKVADVLAALEVATAARVADIGAGDGFYSVRIARAMPPSGRVTAVDVSEKALEQLRQRLKRESVTNVDATLGAFDSPRLTADGARTRNGRFPNCSQGPDVSPIDRSDRHRGMVADCGDESRRVGCSGRLRFANAQADHTAGTQSGTEKMDLMEK